MKNTDYITTFKWVDECKYIEAVADSNDLSNFNSDIECFIRYCEMQKNNAIKEGYDDAAEYIQLIIGDAQS